MAYARRNTTLDATWQRAWTADAVVDLASISAIGGVAGPKHGDIAFVTANSLYYLWMDDGTWRPLPMINYGQLPFPATQNPSADANTLDDYEEGSWTPVIGGATSESGQTYSIQAARYIKNGQAVLAQAFVRLSNAGTITGSPVTLKGLPFTAISGDANAYSGAPIAYFENLLTNYTAMGGLVAPATAVATLYGQTAAVASSTQVQPADIGNTSGLIFCFPYRADA